MFGAHLLEGSSRLCGNLGEMTPPRREIRVKCDWDDDILSLCTLARVKTCVVE